MSTLRFGRTAATVENHIMANVSERSCYEWQQLLNDAFSTIRQLKLGMTRLHAGAGRGEDKIASLFTDLGGRRGANTAAGPAVEDAEVEQPLQQPLQRSRRLPQIPACAASAFECPITGARFTAPVVAADGYTYERSALTAHFSAEGPVTSGSFVSPMTGEPLSTTATFPNRQLVKLMSTQEHETIPDRYRYCLVTAGDDLVDGRVGLPADCLALVLSYSHGPDLVACSMTCRGLRAATAANWLWASALRLDFPSLRATAMTLTPRAAKRQAWAESSASKASKVVELLEWSTSSATETTTSALALYKYKVEMCPRAWRFGGQRRRRTAHVTRTLPTPPMHLKLHFNGRNRSAGKAARSPVVAPTPKG